MQHLHVRLNTCNFRTLALDGGVRGTGDRSRCEGLSAASFLETGVDTGLCTVVSLSVAEPRTLVNSEQLFS